MGMGEGRVAAGSGYAYVAAMEVVLVGMTSQAATGTDLVFVQVFEGGGGLAISSRRERRQWGWNRQVFGPRLGCRE